MHRAILPHARYWSPVGWTSRKRESAIRPLAHHVLANVRWRSGCAQRCDSVLEPAWYRIVARFSALISGPCAMRWKQAGCHKSHSVPFCPRNRKRSSNNEARRNADHPSDTARKQGRILFLPTLPNFPYDASMRVSVARSHKPHDKRLSHAPFPAHDTPDAAPSHPIGPASTRRVNGTRQPLLRYAGLFSPTTASSQPLSRDASQ